MNSKPEETMVEERVELMVSPCSAPTRRLAHFLKPTLTTMAEHELESLLKPTPSSFSSSSGTPRSSLFKMFSSKVSFNGWRHNQTNWRSWVDQIRTQHRSTWIKAGIYTAIDASVHQYKKNIDLILSIAEKWCSDTNTFVFSWGEATITLEDVMVLGGYSVMGDSILSQVHGTDMVQIVKNLEQEGMEIIRSKAKKLCGSQWMKKFMGKGGELEHVALLSLWLSRFVFPSKPFDTINKRVFSIAIQLSRGKSFALAQPILASLYKELKILKEKMVEFSGLEIEEHRQNFETLSLWAPFQILQMWVWERFPVFRPIPSTLIYSNYQPRSVKWDKVKNKKLNNIRSILDSAKSRFKWRPYANDSKNWSNYKFYKEKDEWVVVSKDCEDLELQSFACCLMVTELVGFDCIQHYHPYRVAMQFGLDQDIPVQVGQVKGVDRTVWMNHNIFIENVKLYISSRLFEPGFTVRYLEWWQHSKLPKKDTCLECTTPDPTPRESKLNWLEIKRENDAAEVPPGFAPKEHEKDSDDEMDQVTLAEFFKLERNVIDLTADSDDEFSFQNQLTESSSLYAAHIEHDTEMLPNMGLEENAMQIEDVMENVNENKGHQNQVYDRMSIDNNLEVGSWSFSKFDSPEIEMELQDRVRRLEKVVSALKTAAKFSL